MIDTVWTWTQDSPDCCRGAWMVEDAVDPASFQIASLAELHHFLKMHFDSPICPDGIERWSRVDSVYCTASYGFDDDYYIDTDLQVNLMKIEVNVSVEFVHPDAAVADCRDFLDLRRALGDKIVE